MTKIENIPPIDLSPYEDALIETPGLDKSAGFGAWIRVETPVKGGKATVQNLWDTANPGRRSWDDGFLSFEEAKGRTFYIPFYFCNNMAHWVIEVKNREDFRSLKNILWEPLRNEQITFNSCLNQRTPSRSPAPTLPSPAPQNPEPLMVASGSDFFTEELTANLQGALAAGAFAPSTLALHLSGAAIKASLHQFLQSAAEGTGDVDWESSTPADSEDLWEEGEEVEEIEEGDEEEDWGDDSWG